MTFCDEKLRNNFKFHRVRVIRETRKLKTKSDAIANLEELHKVIQICAKQL